MPKGIYKHKPLSQQHKANIGKEKIPVICQYCGKTKYFCITVAIHRKFCNSKCRYAAGLSVETRKKLSKEKIKFICPVCKKIKYVLPCEFKYMQFCSKSCANNKENNPMFGKKQSKESNEKRRQTILGQTRSEMTCNNISKALSGEKNGIWLKNPTSKQLAERIRRETHEYIISMNGPSKYYLCVDCGKPARAWSNINNHIYRKRVDDYEPRCSSCHLKYDNEELSA